MRRPTKHSADSRKPRLVPAQSRFGCPAASPQRSPQHPRTSPQRRAEVTAMSETPETFTPRPYQAEAIKALIAGWRGTNNRLAVVLPTGAGKTVVFANLIDELLPQMNGQRALVIA